MIKNIEIDLEDKDDLVEKYNEEKLSNELLEYIIKQAMGTKTNDKIKIIINKKKYMEQDCVKFIKNGLKEEYDRSLEMRNNNNMKQVFLLFLGIVFLFFSTLIEEGIIWKEILLISGWVPIWEMIELELFPDAEERHKRRIVKRLLKSEIEERYNGKK